MFRPCCIGKTDDQVRREDSRAFRPSHDGTVREIRRSHYVGFLTSRKSGRMLTISKFTTITRTTTQIQDTGVGSSLPTSGSVDQAFGLPGLDPRPDLFLPHYRESFPSRLIVIQKRVPCHNFDSRIFRPTHHCRNRRQPLRNPQALRWLRPPGLTPITSVNVAPS